MSTQWPIMRCGHAANESDSRGYPRCDCGADGSKIIDTHPSLRGRMAFCADCGKEVRSSEEIAFFQYRPEREMDLFDCGCRGYD